MLGLGVEGYGSGSDSDNENEETPQVASPKHPNPPVRKSSSLQLPPPGTSTKAKAKRKVAIGLPALKAEAVDHEDEEPATKKPRLETGAGASKLFSMLPAPKQKNVVPAAPERVLGAGKGPGLVFNSKTASESNVELESKPSPSFLPPSLLKGKSNISLEEGKPRAPPRTAVQAAPKADFFSLGSSSSSSSTSTTSAPASSSLTISSAPEIPTFEPPEPRVDDPYPGYYQLPSGQWAAHDFSYYEKFRKKWEADYNAHVRALEKGIARGFEGYERGEVEDVDAAKTMERAKVEVKELEERKAITKIAQGEPAKPKMTLNASKTSGIARSRHQLATMLNEAYTNREALEEKIAEGRRNRKEAGNKYGF